MRSPVEGEAEHARPLLLDHELLLPEQLRQELAQPRRHRRHDHGVVVAAGLGFRPLPLAGCNSDAFRVSETDSATDRESTSILLNQEQEGSRLRAPPIQIRPSCVHAFQEITQPKLSQRNAEI